MVAILQQCGFPSCDPKTAHPDGTCDECYYQDHCMFQVDEVLVREPKSIQVRFGKRRDTWEPPKGDVRWVLLDWVHTSSEVLTRPSGTIIILEHEATNHMGLTKGGDPRNG